MLAQLAAVFHLADYRVAARGKHAHRDVAVAHQDSVAFVDGMRERAKCGADSFGCAGDFFRRDGEFLAETQPDGNAALESAGANFWSLQIGDDRDGFFIVPGSAAHRGDAGACSSCVPWEKFRRATSIPAPTRLSINSGDELLGPSVQTILALRSIM